MVLDILNMKVGVYRFHGVITEVACSLASTMQESESLIKMFFVIIHHATTTSTSQYPGRWKMGSRMLLQKNFNFCNFLVSKKK